MEPDEIFLATGPGLEEVLADEARALGFALPRAVPGGVVTTGGWPDVWRANLQLRTASRVLARVARFPAFHLAQLDRRARKLPWAELIAPGTPVKVETTTSRASRIYHAGAASQRIAGAIEAAIGPPPDEAEGATEPLRVLARIDDNIVTISIDTSGEPLHRRGHKRFTGKAPLRETLAAAFLAQMGYRGDEPVFDPMCGSGTFVLEATEIALGLPPGRGRSFAFERLARFDAVAWETMRAHEPAQTSLIFVGRDRDQGAIAGARANAERAGLAKVTTFEQGPVSAAAPPEGPPGLVMVNPPYGARIGNKRQLYGLYAALGERLKARFGGWRVGLVTSEPALARATGLPWASEGPPVPHGGLKVRLYRTERL